MNLATSGLGSEVVWGPKTGSNRSQNVALMGDIGENKSGDFFFVSYFWGFMGFKLFQNG